MNGGMAVQPMTTFPRHPCSLVEAYVIKNGMAHFHIMLPARECEWISLVLGWELRRTRAAILGPKLEAAL